MVGEGLSCPLLSPLCHFPPLSPVCPIIKLEIRVVLSAFPLSWMFSSVLGLIPLPGLAWQVGKGAWLECLWGLSYLSPEGLSDLLKINL